jgi:transposase
MNKIRVCIGIDLGRRSRHKAFLAAPAFSERIKLPKKTFSFYHDQEGFFAIREHILKYTGSWDEVAINFEATSGVWMDIAAFFQEQGATVFTTRTDVVSAVRKNHNKFAKTDRIDSKTLALMPWTFPERLNPFLKPEPRIVHLRSLSDQRFRLVKEITRWENRLLSLMESAWMPLLILFDKDSIFSDSLNALFKKFPHPLNLIGYGRSRFDLWYDKNIHQNIGSKAKENIWTGAQKSMTLWNLLGKSKEERDGFCELLSQDRRILANLKQELKRIEDEIKTAREQVPECDILQQVPGIGNVVSVTLASRMIPIDRFSSAKKNSAYTGLVGRKKASGKREIKGLRITKSGHPQIKRDLALAADVSMHYEPQLADFATRLLSRGKHYNKVRVAVGHKLAVRVYSLLKRYSKGENNVEYEYRDLNNNPITKEVAKELAHNIWLKHKEQMKKGSSPNSLNIVAAN